MKRKTWFWALTPVAVALSLYGCGNGSDSDLAVDNNAQSCSVVSGTGSAVVVGSGLPGDPAAPEAASGYRLGYKAKTASKYMVVANTPLATKAGCDVLKAGGTAVGFAVYFFNYSTWQGRHGLYLEDLYVSPEHRGKGAGMALLRQLARIAVDHDCGRFEWSVLDWNAPAIGFYRRIGAVGMHEWTVQRLEGEALHYSKPDILNPWFVART